MIKLGTAILSLSIVQRVKIENRLVVGVNDA